MGLKGKLRAAFILIRPYSLPGIFLLYYLTKVIVTNNLGLDTRFLFEFVPVLFGWIFLTLLLEAEHKHSNRERIPYSYSAIALIVAVVLSVFFNGLTPIIPLIFFIAFTFLYIKKNSVPILGNTSFISRGFAEAMLFFFSLSILSTTYLQASNIMLALAIVLITSARNLIGDIRDTKFDDVTFTARFGNRLGYTVSIFLYAVGGCVLFIISNGTLGVVFPIILMIILLAIIDNGHMFHRLSVLLSAITIVAYILFIIGDSNLLLLLNIIFLSIICNLVFYNLVPRKSNPDDIAPTFGIAPWSREIQPNKSAVGKHSRIASNLNKKPKT